MAILFMVKSLHQKITLEKLMSACNESEFEKRERLGQEMLNNLIEIMQLSGEPIKQIVADENGNFHEKKNDLSN